MSKLTMHKLKRFVKKRNESGFASNLQFQIDANACGFEVDDLGKARKFKLDGFTGYLWTPVVTRVSERCNVGETKVRLCEFGRGMHLEGHDDSEQMFSLLDRKVEWIEVALD